MENIVQRILDTTLEEIMGDRFSRYAKAIIQDRAIPDVRDGLKPVQRRILFGMYKDHNTYDKPYRKSAKTVGSIMGNYHPHGDSSIYDAMVRMSQWWKQNTPYIDMQGNNGSMDGDTAAAMRYTEARLSKISNELLKDIDKNTVMWAPNFDDTELEPTVLPAKFPNLLVNGSTGISAGYATNIPPHNLGEVIDATIKRIDAPNCRLETILDIVKGPDFPTGGIVEGKKGIMDAFSTGKGKVIIRSTIEFVKEKNREQILVTEIPFDVNKAMLVKKIDDIRIDKKIEGILEVRDESDREGLRIAIDLKMGASRELVLNYLLKNTNLQIAYTYNMVAIVNRRPMTLGILPILDAYIAHQREVITKRTQYDLEYAQNRMHIVEGLIKALSILDAVIKTIRSSKNKSDAKVNLVNEFAFTERQAEAILILQLYRLTNMDVVELEQEFKQLQLVIAALKSILESEDKLKEVMKDELKKVKKEYAIPRKTVIKEEITEIKIDNTDLIPKENVIVTVTKEGYIKRVSLKSYDASIPATVKEGDYVLGNYKMFTMDTLLLFTDLGNYIYLPVYELPELKWKDLGKHVSNLVSLPSEESILFAYPVRDFHTKKDVTLFTKEGMVKRTLLNEFKVQRYSKPISCMKLKENDRVVSVCISDFDKAFVATKHGYGLTYKKEEIPVTGMKSSGVKAITLKEDEVVSGVLYSDAFEYVTVFTDKATAKRMKVTEFEITSRARRGVQIVREVKTNPYSILKVMILSFKETIGIKTTGEEKVLKLTEIPILDRYASGSSFSKFPLKDVYEVVSVKEVEEEVPVLKEDISLDSIDEKIMCIDDLLKRIDD